MADTTLVVYDDLFLQHGHDWHPENRHRLEAITDHLRRTGLWERLTPLDISPAAPEQVAWLHDPEYIGEVRAISAEGGGALDGDTHLTAATHEAAMLAAGGCIAATEAILAGAATTALCLVRPPGHHACPTRGGGFCIFNNAALAAEAAVRSGLQRVAIVDFDVHHGNGTQEMFYHRGDVLYVSLHESPLFPGTGSLDEVGVDGGFGRTINLPLPAGAGDEAAAELLRAVVVPALRGFRPELLIVSAGYDGHQSDPLARWRMTAGGYCEMTSQLTAAAAELCAGRACYVLEGGYDLGALSLSVENTLLAMWGEARLTGSFAPPLHPDAAARVEAHVRHAIETHSERLGL